MPLTIDRRQLLQGAGSVLLAGSGLAGSRANASSDVTQLVIDTRILDVNGKAAKVYSLAQANGKHGLETTSGSNFRVSLSNQLDYDSLVHWHGLTPPSDQDGVPELSQPPLVSRGRYEYDFRLDFPGTHWMHSHVGLQEQNLHAAPLIIHDPAEAGLDEQNVVIMLHDFTFKDPDEILEKLRSGEDGPGHGSTAMKDGTAKKDGMTMKDGMVMKDGAAMKDDMVMKDGAAMKDGTAKKDSMAMKDGMAKKDSMAMEDGMAMDGMNMAMDLNDVEFDAYLANDRTLGDPEIVRVEPGGKIRLRIINAAASTNFMLDLGTINGTVIAVDGHSVEPVAGRRFEIAIAQRVDIRLTLPAGQGAYPILAIREGNVARTGIFLATASGTIPKLAEEGIHPAPPIRIGLEQYLRATTPLPARPVSRRINLNLTGSMARYVWTLNDRTYEDRIPLTVAKDERVEIVMHNQTGMAHPMHLHGHVFQVVAINDQRFSGALRDTVMVPPQQRVTIAFDADNPGRWAFHCHNLYHMGAGMFTSLEYEV